MTTCTQDAFKKAPLVPNCSCCPVRFGLALSSCAVLELNAAARFPLLRLCVHSVLLKCSEAQRVVQCSVSPLIEHRFSFVLNISSLLRTQIRNTGKIQLIRRLSYFSCHRNMPITCCYSKSSLLNLVRHSCTPPRTDWVHILFFQV